MTKDNASPSLETLVTSLRIITRKQGDSLIAVNQAAQEVEKHD